MVYVMGKVGGERMNKLSTEFIKELIELSKVRGVNGMIVGTATDGNYFTALNAMPPTLTEDQELACYYSILGQIVRSKKEGEGWKGMDESLLWQYTYFMSPQS